MRSKIKLIIIIFLITAILFPNIAVGLDLWDSWNEGYECIYPSEGGSGNPLEDPPPVQKPKEDVVVKDIKKTVNLFSGISGNAYENIVGSYKSAGNNAYSIGTVRREAIANNIIVQLVNDGTNEVVDQKTVGADGSYSFKDLDTGDYSVRFVCGFPTGSRNKLLGEGIDIDEIQLAGADISNGPGLKDVLKYNGQDYEATTAGGKASYTDTIEATIMKQSTFATEVMIALDCSGSMFKEKNGVTRLNVVKQAAVKLVENLFEKSNDNLYVGLVIYSKAAIKIVSVTNDKDNLINTIDTLEVGYNIAKASTNDEEKIKYKDNKYMFYKDIKTGKWVNTKVYVSLTNIRLALETVKESFVKGAKTNKYAILVTDGAPTLFVGDEDRIVMPRAKSQMTREEVDNYIKEKLYEQWWLIAEETNEYMKGYAEEFREENDGRNINLLINVLIEDVTESEQKYVDRAFKGRDEPEKPLGTVFYTEDDTINEAVGFQNPEIIYETMNQEARFEHVFENMVESAERREIINNYYKDITNEKVKIFADIVKGNSLSNHTNDDIAEFVNNTYMVAPTNTYKMEKNEGQYPEEEYIVKDNLIYENVNLELTRRDEYKLGLNLEITGLRLILVNNQEYFFKTGQELEEYLKKDPHLLFIEIDEEVKFGATLKIEYGITVKSIAERHGVVTNDFTVLDFLANGMTYNPDEALLSENSKNRDYGWEEITMDKLRDLGYIDEQNDTSIKSGVITSYSKFKDKFYPGKSVLRIGGERKAKIVFSKVLGKNEDFYYDRYAEIVGFSNNLSRRIEFIANYEKLKNGTANPNSAEYTFTTLRKF